MGLFNGTDLSSVFSHRIETQVTDSTNVQIDYHVGELSTVLQDLDTSIQLLVLDASGSRVFEKTYTAPEFAGSGFPSIPGFPNLSVGNATVSRIPDESGFYLSVVRSDSDLLGGGQMPKNNYFLLNLDNTGSIRWSKSFTLNTGIGFTNTSSSVADSGFLYRIGGIEEDGFVSNLIKFTSAGELEFAQRIGGILMVGVALSDAPGNLPFTGVLTDPESESDESDFAMLTVNATTGAIESQIGIDQRVADFGAISVETGNKFFGTLFSSDNPQSESFVSTVFRFDSDFSNPVAYDYGTESQSGFLAVNDADDLVYTIFDEPTGSVGAFSLDGDLVPAQPACEDFTSVTLNTFDPQLTTSAVSVSPADVTVTVQDTTSTLNATTLPLEMLMLATEPCVTGTGEVIVTSQPVDQSVAPGEEVTFSVTATGADPISYQWKKDGVDIVGATESSYLIASVELTDAGDYTVVISNANGDVLSNSAMLTVSSVTGPSIAVQPLSQVVALGKNVSISVIATGSGTITYQWFKDNVAIDGAIGSTLNLSNVMESDLANYYVVVSSGDDSVTSSVAAITEAIDGENALFALYLASLNVPEELSGFGDDADKDGFANGIEYLMGSDANDPASIPEILPSTVMVDGQEYFAINFPRNPLVTDLSVNAEFSSSIEFEAPTTGVEVSSEMGEGGMQRVTQRSSDTVGSKKRIFGRFRGGD